MKRMNRREFLSVFGGATAVSMAIPALASSSVTDKLASDVTSLYVKGLVMVDLGNPDLIRIGFPKAPGHKATLSILPQNGARRTIAIKGNGSVEAHGIASADPKIFIPEIVRMKEFYGDGVRSHVDKCPSVISIPSTSRQRWTLTSFRKKSAEARHPLRASVISSLTVT